MKRLLKVASFTAMLTFTKMIFGFVIAKVISIYAGPTGLAMLGQYQSFINSIIGVVSSPVKTGVVRYTAEYYKEGDFTSCLPWWRASLHWGAGVLFLIVPLIFLFSSDISFWLFGNREYYWIIGVFGIFLPLAALASLINSVLNGLQDYKRFIKLGMLSVIISSILMIYLVYIDNVVGALVAASLQFSIMGIVLFLGVYKQKWFAFNCWFGRTTKENYLGLGKYVFMALVGSVAAPVSIIFVRKILIENVGWEDTGHWQAVWKISEVYLSVITVALGTYYLPKLASLKTFLEVKAEISKSVVIVLPIVTIMAIFIYVFRDFAISLLFSEQFGPARNLFLVQLFGDIIKIVSWMYAYPMLSSGSVKWFVSTEILFSVLLVLLTYFFVLNYGVEGANYAYCVNYIFYFLFVFSNLKSFAVK